MLQLTCPSGVNCDERRSLATFCFGRMADISVIGWRVCSWQNADETASEYNVRCWGTTGRSAGVSGALARRSLGLQPTTETGLFQADRLRPAKSSSIA